jgi:hypothetical protein
MHNLIFCVLPTPFTVLYHVSHRGYQDQQDPSLITKSHRLAVSVCCQGYTRQHGKLINRNDDIGQLIQKPNISKLDANITCPVTCGLNDS